MANQAPSVSRRAVLLGTTAGLAGLSTLWQRSAARETSPTQQAASSNDRTRSAHTSSAWPQYRFDSGRSGVAADWQAPIADFTPTWSLRRRTVGPPVVDADAIYVVTAELSGSDPWLKALSRSDGSTRWRIPVNNDSRGTSRAVPPAVVDGVVYYSSGVTTRAFAADTSNELWASDTVGEWLVVANGHLYLNGANGNFSVLNATDGSVVWERTDKGIGTDIMDQHAVADGTLYLGLTTADEQSYALALDAATGTHRWKTALDDGYPHMVATENGVFATTDTILYSLDPATGVIRWQKQGGSLDRGEVRNVGSPAVGADVVYAPIDGTLAALDIETGKQRWTTSAPGRIVVVGNTIYSITGLDSKLDVIDATTGQRRRQYHYTGAGEFYRTLIPLSDMILVGLYQQYDATTGVSLLALSGDPRDSDGPTTGMPDDDPTEQSTAPPSQTLQPETSPKMTLQSETATPTEIPTATETETSTASPTMRAN